MSTIKVTNLQNASAASPAIVLDANSRATLNGLSYPTEGSLSGRNRIINGAMVVDARNAGASVTPNNSYTLDRWMGQNSQTSKYTVQQSSTIPSFFTKSLLVTSSSAYSVTSSDYFFLNQPIEAFNVDDIGFGSASAKSLTLSFWVRSSLTGTFGGSIRNYNTDRSYPFSYSISSANTFEFKTVTIPGDTSGTWVAGTNSVGLYLAFCIGAGSSFLSTAGSWAAGNFVGPTGQTSVVGTNGATFYITGVQLEAGSVATPFERRSYTTELQLCQRYFATVGDGANPYAVLGDGRFASSTAFSCRFKLPVTMRATPSATTASATYVIFEGTNSRTVGAIAIYSAGSDGVEGDITTASATTGAYGQLRGNAAAPNAPRILFSAEL